MDSSNDREEDVKWLLRVMQQPVKTFSSDHKILVYVLHTQVFISSNKIEQDFYPVTIGVEIHHTNLRGMTGGLSRSKIGDMLWELENAGFIVKKLEKGTNEKGYIQAQMYIKPTEKFVPELFAIKKDQLYKVVHS